MFSYLNKRLERIGINYDIVLSNCKKRHTNSLVLITIILIVTIIKFALDNDPWFVVCILLLSIGLILECISLFRLRNIEPFTDKATKIVIDELNNVGVMKKLLKGENNNFKVEELTAIKVTDIQDFEMKSIRKFIIDYKFTKEVIFCIALSCTVGIIVSKYYHIISNNSLNQIIISLVGLVGVVCLILLLIGLGLPVNKIVYRGLLNKLTSYYETGVISGEQYKASILYFSDCTLEGVFTDEEYEYLVSNELIYNYDIVVKYIKSCNIERILGLISLGIMLAFGLYFVKPLYALFGLIPVLLCVMFIRVNDKTRNLEKYERKLLNQPEKLTALITKELPKEFLVDL